MQNLLSQLPDIGIDVGAFVTATITALGAVVVVVVGGYFAFLLVRKAMGWARSAFGDYVEYAKHGHDYDSWSDWRDSSRRADEDGYD